MEIRQLKHFIAAVEAGSLRTACEEVHITHAALSMSLKNLEENLGVQLLIKNRNGITMTNAGEQFMVTAHALLRQLDDLRASLQNTQDNPAGKVRLGLTYAVTNSLAAPLFKRITERFPDISLEIDEGNTTSLERLFENKMLDLMIAYDVIENMSQKCIPLYIEQLYLVSAYDPKLELDAEINCKELEKYPILSSPGTHSMRRSIEKYAFDNGIKLNYLFDFKSPHAALRIVEEGLAHTIAPWDLIYSHVQGKLVTARKIVNPPIERTVCLISSLQEAPTQATNAMVTAIIFAVEEARKKGSLRGRSFITKN